VNTAQVYVRQGNKTFRDILDIDIGAIAGVTSTLVGTSGTPARATPFNLLTCICSIDALLRRRRFQATYKFNLYGLALCCLIVAPYDLYTRHVVLCLSRVQAYIAKAHFC
jgi:hypothetical protein